MPTQRRKRERRRHRAALGLGSGNWKPAVTLEIDQECSGAEEQWRRLTAAAGPPPARVARHERAPRQDREGDVHLAEVEAGVADEDPEAGSTSILQQLLITQTKLLEKMAVPKLDPITATLTGGSSSSEKATGLAAAKGVTAREAYMKFVNSQQSLSTAVRNSAAIELGEDSAGVSDEEVRRKANGGGRAPATGNVCAFSRPCVRCPLASSQILNWNFGRLEAF